METLDYTRGVHIEMRYPGVFFISISAILNQILHAAVAYSRVQNGLDLVFLLAIHKHRRRGGRLVASREGIGRGRRQLYNREDRMQATHGVRQA